MSEVVKLIYFGPRPAGRSPVDFRARRRRHGKLGMSLPFFENISLYK